MTEKNIEEEKKTRDAATSGSPEPEDASSNGQTQDNSTHARVPVLKTYKLYIGGKFPRSESGYYFQATAPDGKVLGNVCLASRKDLRDAVKAARGAQPAWNGRSAYNRSQILYRAGEMLEGRRVQFETELVDQGHSPATARTEVEASIDRLIYYAGWADKYQQIMSAINPVASAHFNFSVPEPMGVVVALAPEDSPLLALVGLIAPAIVGGNTIVALASNKAPLSAITLAEVLATSDLPDGVVNILTGRRADLMAHIGSHMDINSVLYAAGHLDELKELQIAAADNVKRVIPRDIKNWQDATTESPYWIMDTQEIKTTWHPIEHIASAGAKY